MESIIVTISNWDKYNPRKDYKRPWWFAMSNRLLEDPDFYSFSDAEIRAWIYILSQASQRASKEIRVHFDHASRVCNVKTQALKSAVKKLEKIGVLSASVQDPNAICTGHERYITEHNITEHNINLDQASARSIASFDLDLLYAKYPRKVGKEKGLAKLKAQIRTQADYEAVGIALNHYVQYCQANQSEQRFIKHFATWVSEWRDWLDPNTGKSEDFSKSKAALITEEEWNEMLRRKNESVGI